jgi:hypothetical protein
MRQAGSAMGGELAGTQLRINKTLYHLYCYMLARFGTCENVLSVCGEKLFLFT